MVKDLISLTGDSEGASLNFGEAIMLNFCIPVVFFFVVFLSFFPLRLVLLILIADPLKLHEDFVITYF